MEIRSTDVVVVGGGIVGCASAYYLAQKGVSVIVCEKGNVGLEQSSRNWGFVRQQGRDAAELPLMMASNRIWQGLEAELQADLEWIQGGNLVLAYDDKRLEQFEQWLPQAMEHGLETRLLTAQQLRQLVPAVKPKILGAMFTPSDGQAEPQKVCPAFQRAAQNQRIKGIYETVDVQVITPNDAMPPQIHTSLCITYSSKLADPEIEGHHPFR